MDRNTWTDMRNLNEVADVAFRLKEGSLSLTELAEQVRLDDEGWSLLASNMGLLAGGNG